MAWTSPRTWVAGETVTAALLNTHVRDNLKAIGDPWTTYTPTWTGAGGNPAIGNGTLTGAYVAAGKLIHFRIVITMGSATTYGTGQWSLTLPVTPATIGRPYFTTSQYDSGTADRPGVAIWNSATSKIDLGTYPTTAGNPLAAVTSTVPFTWGSADVLTITGTYEAA